MADIFYESDANFTVRAWAEVRNEKGRTPTTRYRVRWWYAGGDKDQGSAPTEADARAAAAETWKAHLDGLLDAPVTAPETIGALVDLFCARTDLAPATKETYAKTLKRFVAFVGADRDLAHVGKGAIAKWFDAGCPGDAKPRYRNDGSEIVRPPAKPVSKASYLRTLSALFKWAVKSRYMTADPSKDQAIERFRTTIRPWLQFQEWQPFLDACKGQRKRLPDGSVIELVSGHRIRAEFALHTGLRAGELSEARWSWLHGTVGMPALTVPASKSARARAIPLDLRAQAILTEAAAHWTRPGDGTGDSLIFGQMDIDNLSRDTAKACKRAGVTLTDFHGMRRSCGARWLQLGIPLFHVSRMLGHADVSTTARHYAGLADSTLAAEIDKVNQAAAAVMNGNVTPIWQAK